MTQCAKSEIGSGRLDSVGHPVAANAAALVTHAIRAGCGPGRNDFDPAVRDRLLAGAMIPSALVDRAQKFRRWYKARVMELFKTVDVILAHRRLAWRQK